MPQALSQMNLIAFSKKSWKRCVKASLLFLLTYFFIFHLLNVTKKTFISERVN